MRAYRLWWLWGVIFAIGCTRYPPVKNLYPRSGPIVFFGDSLTYGTGAPKGKGVVDILARRLGVEFVNKGVPGDTTEGALRRLKKDVLDLHPALVVVELGGNDFLRKVPPEVTFANLETIITKIQNQGAPVLLLGVQGGLFKDKYASRYRALARNLKTAYVDNILQGILTSPALKYDAIHPNAKGYERMADKIEPELRRLLEGIGRIKPVH